MTNFVASGYIENAARTQSEIKTALENLRSIMYEMPGGGLEATATIATDAITPSNNWGAAIAVDTEGAASTDNLKTITATNCRDGHILYIRSTSSARTVVVYASGGGAGQILTQDGSSISLTDPKQWVALKYNAAVTAWEEVARSQNIDCFPIAGVSAYYLLGRGSGSGKASYQALSLGHLGTLMDTTLGWAAKGSALSVSSNTITPIQAFQEVDTSGAAQEIRSIAVTNMTDGRFLILQPSSNSYALTLKHNYGGATNPLTLKGSADYVMSTTDMGIMLMRQSTGWKEIARFGGSSAGASAGIVQGRLTLTSGSPVTGNVTAAGTLYFTPYNGNQVATYSGSAWTLSTFTEKSISLATCKKYVNYDVFMVDSTLALELLEWKSVTASNNPSAGSSVSISTSDTTGVVVGQWITVANSAHTTVEECEVTAFSTNTSVTVRTLANSYTAPKMYYAARATALTTQDGVYVKSGATTRLYLGTISAQAGDGSSGGTTDDSRITYSGVWNNYNRIASVSSAKTTTASYTYNSSTIREAEGSGVYGTSRIGFVVGLSEDDVKISNAVTLVPGSANPSYGYIGFDSVAALASNSTIATFAQTVGNLSGMFSEYATKPSIGRHAAIRLEQCTNSGAASTFYGNSATVSVGSTGMYMEHKR